MATDLPAKHGTVTVAVFARAPLPGAAKTRLIPALGAAAAAQLALRMLDETLRCAVASAIGPVTLSCTPDATEPLLLAAARRHGVALAAQGDGDLGARMHRALTAGLAGHAGAIVIGTDCPAMTATVLHQAAQALACHAAVFVPAADGGYVLAGITQPAPALFADMTWSTDTVMLHTRERLARLGIDAAELPTLHDVDLPADLIHVPEDWLEFHASFYQ